MMKCVYQPSLPPAEGETANLSRFAVRFHVEELTAKPISITNPDYWKVEPTLVRLKIKVPGL